MCSAAGDNGRNRLMSSLILGFRYIGLRACLSRPSGRRTEAMSPVAQSLFKEEWRLLLGRSVVIVADDPRDFPCAVFVLPQMNESSFPNSLRILPAPGDESDEHLSPLRHSPSCNALAVSLERVFSSTFDIPTRICAFCIPEGSLGSSNAPELTPFRTIFCPTPTL